jgi:hypothetical protein
VDLLEGTYRGEASPHRTSYRAEVRNEVTMEEVLAASSHGRTQWLAPLPGSTAGCGKPHVRWCGRVTARNRRDPTRSVRKASRFTSSPAASAGQAGIACPRARRRLESRKKKICFASSIVLRQYLTIWLRIWCRLANAGGSDLSAEPRTHPTRRPPGLADGLGRTRS